MCRHVGVGINAVWSDLSYPPVTDLRDFSGMLIGIALSGVFWLSGMNVVSAVEMTCGWGMAVEMDIVIG